MITNIVENCPKGEWTRDGLHKYLIEVAAQSPARKRKVGAVIAALTPWDTYVIISAGHNYNPTGNPCETEDNITPPEVVHAEVAAIENFNEGNIPIVPGPFENVPIPKENMVLFTTHPPCDGCKAAIYAAGLTYEVMSDFMKFDDNKPRMALVPASLGIEVAKVLTYGAKKYKANNWRKVQTRERYVSALERHLAAYKNGEEVDPESGLLHISHIACNAAFLIELNDLPMLEEEN